MNKSLLLLILSAFIISGSSAQNTVAQAWVQRFNGPDSLSDISTAIDVHGHVFVAGTTGDSITGNNMVVIKYDLQGNELWHQSYTSPGNFSDAVRDMAVDNNCNAYITGTSFNTATANDIVSIKFNGAGSIDWVQSFSNPGLSDDIPFGIERDLSGNLYVTARTGTSLGVDILLLKYNALGNLLWQQTFNGPAGSVDIPRAMQLDQNGNIIIAGSATVQGPTVNNSDYVVLKYDPAGTLFWSFYYGHNADGGDDLCDRSQQ